MIQIRFTALILLVLAGGLWAASPAPFVTGKGDLVVYRGFEDDNGGFYIAWVQNEQEKSAALRAQHFDPKGQPVWDAGGIVISAHLVSAMDWSGLADGQGGLTLFWDEADGVHAQRFRPDGTRRRPGQSVLMSTSTAIQPDAVPDAEGGTLIVWREILPVGRYVLKAQRIDQDGQWLWPHGGLRVSWRASNQTNPRVIDDNMSGMIVAWRDEANSASELRVQRMDFQGNRLWGEEGIKVTAPVGVTEFPQIAPLGTGEVVLAWTASVSQTSQIFLQKVGPDAALKWGNMTLVSNMPAQYNRWHPVLCGDQEGGTWIAWEDFRNQLNYQVELNHLHEDGRSPWTRGEIAAAPALGDQGNAAMAVDGKEGVWLTWIDNRSATIGLYAQEIDGSATRLQGNSGRLIADGLNRPLNPELVSIEPGRAIVVWANRPKKGQWSLFWSLLEAPRPPQ